MRILIHVRGVRRCSAMTDESDAQNYMFSVTVMALVLLLDT